MGRSLDVNCDGSFDGPSHPRYEGTEVVSPIVSVAKDSTSAMPRQHLVIKSSAPPPSGAEIGVQDGVQDGYVNVLSCSAICSHGRSSH